MRLSVPRLVLVAGVLPILACPEYVGDPRQNSDGGVFSPSDAASASDASRDGGMDAGANDAGQVGDGNASDGGTDGGPRVIQCAPLPAVVGNVLSIGSGFYPAFRFEVTSITQVQAVGIAAHSDGAAGSIFAALVQLAGPTDYPDSATLTTTDVLRTALIDVPTGAGVTVVSSPLSRTLAAGWYAIVFGTGRFGATLATGYSPSSSSATSCVSQPGTLTPFTIRIADGFFQPVAGSPHMFVTVTP